MNIIVAFKVVPDDQDIQVTKNHNLDYSKAKPVVSAYDLNALQAAVELARECEESQVKAITIGPCSIDDSKLKKNVLARGADELLMIADDAYADLDAYATAQALNELLVDLKPFDLVLCGDGSADNYAQQTDVQLAAHLRLPFLNAVTAIMPEEGFLLVERTLEEVIEKLRVPLPAVLSVTPDIAMADIPGMKDILAAGKKPAKVTKGNKLFQQGVEVVSTVIPQEVARGCQIFDANTDGAIQKFAEILRTTQ